MDIQKFMSEVFGEIDVFEDQGHGLWFSGNQVAKALGYDDKHLSQSIKRFVEPNDQKTLNFRDSLNLSESILWSNPNDFRPKIIISEYGLYALIMRSYAPRAREFQHWVTHTILPSIRQNGGYIEGQENLDSDELQKVKNQIRQMKDKIAFLQKRRHEILADNRNQKAQLKHLHREGRALSEYADLWEKMYEVLMDEYAELQDQGKPSEMLVEDVNQPEDDKSNQQPKKERYWVTDSQGLIVRTEWK